MERRFNIEAFRNIGFKDEKPNAEGIILNNSLYKDKIGDLVILIGPNNSGKSNVLDALECFSKNQISNRDKTDLFMEPDKRRPTLTLTSKDEEYICGCKLYDNNNVGYFCPSLENLKFSIKNNLPSFSSLDDYMIQTQRLVDLQMGQLSYNIFRNFWDSIGNKDKQMVEVVQKACESIVDIVDTMRGAYNYGNFKNYVVSRSPLYGKFLNDYEAYKYNAKLDLKRVNADYMSRYEMNFVPRIVKYKQQNLTNNDLVSSYSDIENNHFFKSLFNIIEFSFETLKNTYSTFNEQNNRGYLTQLEKKLNKIIKKISDNFNKMYYVKDNSYSFDLKLESNDISFSIFRGEQAISLNYQSTGFRWFFDLFFNVLAANELKPGDIIIMDEPATNLHVSGQEELRAFLKEYAVKSGITFIIATHLPFLIDMDYLDEIRIISNKDNITYIDNDFSAIDLDDPDSLLPVKKALTVRNSVLIDPDQLVVFVEGITDYNYLVAMKHVLKRNDLEEHDSENYVSKYENITFLPVKGIGKTKDQQKEISARLLQIRKHNPTLLVDGDKAGVEMKKLNEKDSELKVICLKDVDEKFEEIEKLFSDEDLNKYKLVDKSGKYIKHASTSSVFKKSVIIGQDSLSKETIENFKKLFDNLID